jgi:hypothetical protein
MKGLVAKPSPHRPMLSLALLSEKVTSTRMRESIAKPNK